MGAPQEHSVKPAVIPEPGVVDGIVKEGADTTDIAAASEIAAADVPVVSAEPTAEQ